MSPFNPGIAKTKFNFYIQNKLDVLKDAGFRHEVRHHAAAVQDYVVADSRVAEEPVYDYKPADVVAQDYVEVQDYVVVDSRVAEGPVYDCMPAGAVVQDY
jgi:hypothetical protein